MGTIINLTTMNTLTIIISGVLLVTVILLIIVSTLCYKQKETIKKITKTENILKENYKDLIKQIYEFINEIKNVSNPEDIDREKLINVFIQKYPWSLISKLPNINSTDIVNNFFNAMEQALNSKELNGYKNMTTMLHNEIDKFTSKLKEMTTSERTEQNREAFAELTRIGLFTMNAIYYYEDIVKIENCTTEDIRHFITTNSTEANYNPQDTHEWARILKAALSDMGLTNNEYMLMGYKF